MTIKTSRKARLRATVATALLASLLPATAWAECLVEADTILICSDDAPDTRIIESAYDRYEITGRYQGITISGLDGALILTAASQISHTPSDAADAAIVIESASADGSFTHEGVIQSSVGNGVYFAAENATGAANELGGFTNTGTITTSAPGYEAVVLEGRITGDVNNSGTISGVYTGLFSSFIGGDLINSGTISATGDVDAAGVEVTSVIGDVINSGTISGDAYGVIGVSLEGGLFNAGQITSSGTAVDVITLGGFTNVGRVEGGAYGLVSQTLNGDLDLRSNSLISGGVRAIDVGTLNGDLLIGAQVWADNGIVIDQLNGGVLNTGDLTLTGAGLSIGTLTHTRNTPTIDFGALRLENASTGTGLALRVDDFQLGDHVLINAELDGGASFDFSNSDASVTRNVFVHGRYETDLGSGLSGLVLDGGANIRFLNSFGETLEVFGDECGLCVTNLTAIPGVDIEPTTPVGLPGAGSAHSLAGLFFGRTAALDIELVNSGETADRMNTLFLNGSAFSQTGDAIHLRGDLSGLSLAQFPILGAWAPQGSAVTIEGNVDRLLVRGSRQGASPTDVLQDYLSRFLDAEDIETYLAPNRDFTDYFSRRVAMFAARDHALHVTGDIEQFRFGFGNDRTRPSAYSLEGDAIRIDGDVSQAFITGVAISYAASADAAGLRIGGTSGTRLSIASFSVIRGQTAVVLGDGDDQVFIGRGANLFAYGDTVMDLGDGDDTVHATGAILEANVTPPTVPTSSSVASIQSVAAPFNLSAGLIRGGDGDDTIILEGDSTLDLLLTDFEQLTVAEGGTLTFGRDQTVDNVTVLSGGLDLNGFDLTGDLTLVDSTLTGNGGRIEGALTTLGNVLVEDLELGGDFTISGLLNPGGFGVIDTLFVGGDFALLPEDGALAVSTIANQQATDVTAGAAARLAIDFDGLRHDRVRVDGAAQLQGDLYLLGDLTDALKSRQSFNLVTAQGGLSGGLTLANTGGVLFTPVIEQSATALRLNFERAANFADALNASTGNRQRAAQGLQAQWDAGPSEVDDVLLSLDAGLPAAGTLQGYAAEPAAAVLRDGAETAGLIARTVAACGHDTASCSGSDRGWVQYSRSATWLDGDANAGKVRQSTSLTSFGLRHAFTPELNLGAYGAMARTRVKVEAGDYGRGENETLSAGAFADFTSGRVSMFALVGVGKAESETNRRTPLGVATGNTEQWLTLGRASARLALSQGPLMSGLTVSYAHARSDMDRYTEAGPNGFDLDLAPEDYQSDQAELAFDASTTLGEPGSGRIWRVGAEAGYAVNLSDTAAIVRASFANSSVGFDTFGPDGGEDGPVASLSLSSQDPNGRFQLDLQASGRWTDSRASATVTGQLGWRF